MTIDDEYIYFLKASLFTNILAMPLKSVPGAFCDIVFYGEHTNCKIGVSDHLLQDGTDAYTLSMQEYTSDGLWGKGSGWKACRVDDEFGHPIHERLATPRKIALYESNEIHNRVESPRRIWDRLAAIKIISMQSELTIAVGDYPMTIIVDARTHSDVAMLREYRNIGYI